MPWRSGIHASVSTNYLFKEYGEYDFSCWSTVDKSTLLFHQHLVAVEQLLLGNASGQVNCCYSELHSMFV